MNRPQRRNALTDHVILGLRDAILAADADESVRVVVLTAPATRPFAQART